MSARTVLVMALLCVFVSRGYATHFVVYGDTRTNASQHQKVIDAISNVNPEFVLSVGDLWDGYGTTTYTTILKKNANIASLLLGNKYLVARGNHESESSVLAFSPPIVLNKSIKYSSKIGNVFFVTSGYGADTAFFRRELTSAAATTSKWKIVFIHVPVYSSGSSHGAKGNAGLEALCDKYGVAIVFGGHDHIYERTYLMYNRAIATKSNAITSSQKGTFYVVTGSGGAPYNSVAGSTWTAAKLGGTLEFCDITATDLELSFKARKTDGSVFDSFTMAPRGGSPLGTVHSVAAVKTHRSTPRSVYDFSGRTVVKRDEQPMPRITVGQ